MFPLPYILRSSQKRPRLLPHFLFPPHLLPYWKWYQLSSPWGTCLPRNYYTKCKPQNHNSLEEKVSPTSPLTRRPLGSTLPSSTTAVFAPFMAFWCSRANDVSGSLVVMSTPGPVQLRTWQPLCWETGYLHSLYCKASSRCLSLSIQGLMLLVLSLLEELFLLGLQPGESDQKWVQEPRSCQAEPLFIPFSSYVDPQPYTWHRHLPFQHCMY